MTGLEWLLEHYPDDIYFMCEYWNKHNGSRVYALKFFESLPQNRMEKLHSLALEDLRKNTPVEEGDL